MTKKKDLSDWINGTLNNRIKDAVDFDIKYVFDIDLTFLRERDLRKIKKALEEKDAT